MTNYYRSMSDHEVVLFETPEAKGFVDRMTKDELLVWLAQHPEGDFVWIDA